MEPLVALGELDRWVVGHLYRLLLRELGVICPPSPELQRVKEIRVNRSWVVLLKVL